MQCLGGPLPVSSYAGMSIVEGINKNIQISRDHLSNIRFLISDVIVPINLNVRKWFEFEISKILNILMIEIINHF